MRPDGHETRGFTAANRLRATDTYLALVHPGLLRQPGSLYVDVGYGARPVTTIETWRRLRQVAPDLRVVGTERDPDRVTAGNRLLLEAGLTCCGPSIGVREGGFRLPLHPGEMASVVRAMNVLRQYDEAEVEDALVMLAGGMATNAVLIEGTCDPHGRLLVFTEYRRTATQITPARRQASTDLLSAERLVFAPRLRHGFEPRQLQAVLPKRFIHRAAPGEPIDRFFAAWEREWLRHRPGRTLRGRFAVTAESLADDPSLCVQRRPSIERRGFLVVSLQAGPFAAS